MRSDRAASSGKHARPEEKKKKGFFRRLFGLIGWMFLIVILLVIGMMGYLTATEFRPDDVEPAEVIGGGSAELSTGDSFSIMTWNIGYGALGDNADFFMDGGTMVQTADEDRVRSNLSGINAQIAAADPDILFLQEVDIDSARSHNINEFELIMEEHPDMSAAFANNFKAAYVPYPWPPIGKVDSGVATFSSFPVSESERVQLPIPFKWPISMANLKRCVLVSRIPLKDSDKELVLFDLHLEAYDNGEGKAAQTEMLEGLLNDEFAKGNYVIAGGDFNQIFSSEDTGKYPAQEGKWQAGEIDVNKIGGKWKFIMDEKVPTCRSLDQPYAGADKDTFQYYLIDGFIVSDNIKVNKANTMDLGFVTSDHNPVMMEVTLLKEKGQEKQ